MVDDEGHGRGFASYVPGVFLFWIQLKEKVQNKTVIQHITKVWIQATTPHWFCLRNQIWVSKHPLSHLVHATSTTTRALKKYKYTDRMDQPELKAQWCVSWCQHCGCVPPSLTLETHYRDLFKSRVQTGYWLPRLWAHFLSPRWSDWIPRVCTNGCTTSLYRSQAVADFISSWRVSIYVGVCFSVQGQHWQRQTKGKLKGQIRCEEREEGEIPDQSALTLFLSADLREIRFVLHRVLSVFVCACSHSRKNVFLTHFSSYRHADICLF